MTRCYEVNGKIFSTKIGAIIEANNTLADVTWKFHDDVFSSLDWTQEPSQSLAEFYKIRALQIREKYDYVVLLCSGGADSTNVLKTFLSNDIRIDEIIAAAPMSGLRDYKFNDIDTSHNNTISETIYTQLPLINAVSQSHPNIKITLHDYFDDMLAYKTDEWLLRCDDWIHPSSAARYRYERHKHLRDMADSGKRLAFVYGIDKPTLCLGPESRNLYMLFADLSVNVQRPAFDREYPNVDNVLFYWAAELPNMIIKQCHQLARWILEPNNAYARQFLLDRSILLSFEEHRVRHSKYERAIVPCIYAETHRSIFQAEKPIKFFLGEHDNWFYQLHNKTRMHEMMISDVSHLYGGLDKKYFNVAENGFATYYNYYSIGHISNFLPRPITS